MVNVERTDFFPTCVYKFKHEFVEKELYKMVKHIEDNSLSEHNGHLIKRTGSQTQDELHKIDTFSNLTNTISKVTRHILNEQEYMGEIEITNMWVNISQKGDAHMPHNHSNNIFSGVWYPFKNKITPIFFYDPRPVGNFWSPRKYEKWID